MGVEIRRGTGRYITRDEGVFTRHSFAFGAHYDPDNTRFGRLVCHDDHLLGPGRGFDDHPHQGVEIVTWVLTGHLRHHDSAGHTGEVHPGEVQVLSAGTGVTHREVAGSAPLRFVQAWLVPDEPDTPPAYDVRAVDLRPGVLTEVVTVCGDATLSVARLDTGDTLALPDAPRLHVFVAGGALTRSSLAEPLAEGDAFRITREPGEPGEPGAGGLQVTAAVPTELMVWSLC